MTIIDDDRVLWTHSGTRGTAVRPVVPLSGPWYRYQAVVYRYQAVVGTLYMRLYMTL